jgi:hypothetical protein
MNPGIDKEVIEYLGGCHCGAITFSFSAPPITNGVRCNCSMCKRRSATMTAFTLPSEKLNITVTGDALSLYQFGSDRARHYFCKVCGIYPFHQPFRKPDQYRVNLGCIEGIEPSGYPFELLDGAAI